MTSIAAEQLKAIIELVKENKDLDVVKCLTSIIFDNCLDIHDEKKLYSFFDNLDDKEKTDEFFGQFEEKPGDWWVVFDDKKYKLIPVQEKPESGYYYERNGKFWVMPDDLASVYKEDEDIMKSSCSIYQQQQ